MKTNSILCEHIDVPKAPPGSRTFSRDFAIELADSIMIDGMINAIVVRPNPATPGRYLLVIGRHRLYAIKNVLKQPFIEARVMEGMDDTDAEFASCVENLWRNPLSKAQHALALKKWHERWLAKSDEVALKIGATKQDSQTEKTAAELAGAEKVADEAQAGDDAKAESKEQAREREFDLTAAAATGQSLGSVRRTKRIAEAFTEIQLEVFRQMSVNQTDMTTIARIKDKNQRSEVVNLIATGMAPTEAVAEVMKERAPVRDTGDGKAVHEAKAAAKQETVPKLSDDEWFDRECGEKAKMFKNPAKFKTDAILFRQISESRHTFRLKSKEFVSEAKIGNVYGGFTNLVNRLISISHPKDWLICPECKGNGFHAGLSSSLATNNCSRCYGSGFLTKSEAYL